MVAGPRVGDTVHYTRATGGAVARCCAAIVVEQHDDPEKLCLYVLTPRDGNTLRTTVNYDADGATIGADGDTWAAWGVFTPGTWHHIH